MLSNKIKLSKQDRELIEKARCYYDAHIGMDTSIVARENVIKEMLEGLLREIRFDTHIAEQCLCRKGFGCNSKTCRNENCPLQKRWQ